ncbi:MAG: MFS transporter [Acidobacteriota bacterium]
MARERAGWYCYDWANSAFYTSVVTLIFGPYVTEELAKPAADAAGYIYPLGIAIYARSYWGYLIALAVVLQVLVLPVIGAIVDSSGRKKQLLGVFAYAGALATMAMYFLEGTAYMAAGVLFLLANLSFGASIVVYNAFLPAIAAPEERDAVSSTGWGIGYLGGGLLLALNLALFRYAGSLGLSEAHAARINLCSAGAWWALFSIIPMLTLRNRAPVGVGHARPLRDLTKYPQALTFLVAYMLYNDAIQAVIALAVQFGSDELGMPMATLALAILMVQFVGFFGALGFNQAARLIGAKRAVMASLVVWTGVLGAIYGWVRTTADFFLMAALVAVVLGGSQALSRSLFSQLIPKGAEAEYFSLYEISEKGTSWLCPLFFALALQFTRSYRLAILSLIVFFVLGLAVLARVDVRRGMAEAGQNRN